MSFARENYKLNEEMLCIWQKFVVPFCGRDDLMASDALKIYKEVD
jgi:hypothetical protein